jgi:hypothetical protein
LVEYSKLPGGRKRLFKHVFLPKHVAGRIIFYSYVELGEGENSTFFVEKPELPFVTSPL